ncbi:MAG: hypothetical protein ABI613_00685 [Gemmatimonadota bacterium]
MTGHVFHPGHHDLHGITVVLETNGPQMFVGRFDSQDEKGVHLIGVSVFDPVTSTQSSEEFLNRTRRFGVKVDRAHYLVPLTSVLQIRPLGDPE